MVIRTLDGMAAGGMHDLVGGGFHRYSVDARWLVPHFEKMLYDNALLASAYLHALGRHRRGSLPRDRGGHGRVHAAGAAAPGRRPRLGARRRHRRRRGADPHLDRRTSSRRSTSTPPAWSRSSTVARSSVGRSPRPSASACSQSEAHARSRSRDDKVITSWNGLALAAIAEAGRRLGRADWIEAASGSRRSAPSSLTAGDGTLLRSWRDGQDEWAGIPRRLRQPRTRPARASPRDGRSPLAARGPSACDRGARAIRRRGATAASSSQPRGHDAHVCGRGRRTSTTTRALRATRCWPPSSFASVGSGVTRRSRSAASAALRLVVPALGRAPRAFSWALCALDLHLAPPRELALLGACRQRARPASRWHPSHPARWRRSGLTRRVPLLAGKTAVDGRPTAYLCERFACRHR